MLNKRIPTLLGLLILIIGFFIVLFGLTQFQSFVSRATPQNMPKSVTFSNFINEGFSVSWVTEEKVIGTAFLAKENKFFRDDRDNTSRDSRSYISHHVTFSSLNPDKEISFTLLSGNAVYGTTHDSSYVSVKISDSDICEIKNVPGIPSNCFPFRIKIPSNLTPISSLTNLVNGIVYSDDGSVPVMDGIVYFSFSDSSIQSTLLKGNGTWILPLNFIRTTALTSYFLLPSAQVPIQVRVQSGREGLQISCPFNDKQPYSFPAFYIGKKPECPKLSE